MSGKLFGFFPRSCDHLGSRFFLPVLNLIRGLGGEKLKGYPRIRSLTALLVQMYVRINIEEPPIRLSKLLELHRIIFTEIEVKYVKIL